LPFLFKQIFLGNFQYITNPIPFQPRSPVLQESTMSSALRESPCIGTGWSETTNDENESVVRHSIEAPIASGPAGNPLGRPLGLLSNVAPTIGAATKALRRGGF
jgi:hypothetical protein